MRTGLCRPSKRRDRLSRPRHHVRKCASQTPILRKSVEELESANGYSNPNGEAGSEIEDWEQSIRSSIRRRDRRMLSVLAVSMGAPHREKATQIIIEEVTATSGRAAVTSFCGLLGDIDCFRRDSLHVISVVEIWRGVKAWFEEQGPNIGQWNRVMKTLCDYRSDESLEEAEEILTSLEASDSPQPNAAMYTYYLWALGRKNGPANSLAVLYRMLNHNVEPDGECYKALMIVYAKDKTRIGMDAAKMWLQKADMAFRRQHARQENILRGALVSLYSELIVGCSMSGRLQDAYSIIGMLHVRGLVPSKRTFYLLLQATMSLDPQGLDLCRDILRTMTRMGVTPDARHYNQVILGYGAQGMVSEAFRLADRMQRNGITWDQDTYYYLIITVLKGSREEEVAISRQLLGKMRRQGVPPQQRHYIVTLLGLGTAGFISDAENLFGKMRSLGTTMMAYHAMINAHCLLQNIGKAEEVLALMEEDGHPPNTLTYNILLDGYLKAGQYVRALQLYPTIEKLIKSLEVALKNESAAEPLTERDEALHAKRGQPVRHLAGIFATLLTCASEVQENETIIRLMKDLVRLRIPLTRPILARAVAKVADSLEGSGVALPREALARRVVDEDSRDPADWLEIETQYQFLKSVPNMDPQWEVGASQRASASLRGELGVSFWGNPRTPTRKEAARRWRHGAGNKGMKPALFSPHILSKTVEDLAKELSTVSTRSSSSSSSSSSGSGSEGAEQVVREKGRRATGRRLLYACLRESPLSPTHSHAAVEDHYLETLYARPLTTLTLRPSEQAVALLGKESRESLRSLFNGFGEPGAKGSPTYVFLSPWLMDPDALCVLLAARACHPESVLLLRHLQPDVFKRPGPPHIKRLLQRCSERRDMLLGSMLVSALEALPAGVLINNRTLIANNPGAREANVHSFDRMLQGAVFGALPRDQRTDEHAPSRKWQDWLMDNGLRQIIHFTDEEARIDSLRHATGWSAQGVFRVRGCFDGQVAVDFFDPDSDSGEVLEYFS